MPWSASVTTSSGLLISFFISPPNKPSDGTKHFEVARARCEERLVGQSAEAPADDGAYDGNPRVTPIRVPLAGDRQDRVDDPRSEVAGRVDCVPGGASER